MYFQARWDEHGSSREPENAKDKTKIASICEIVPTHAACIVIVFEEQKSQLV